LATPATKTSAPAITASAARCAVRASPDAGDAAAANEINPRHGKEINGATQVLQRTRCRPRSGGTKNPRRMFFFFSTLKSDVLVVPVDRKKGLTISEARTGKQKGGGFSYPETFWTLFRTFSVTKM
jgi:hypothetical protein